MATTTFQKETMKTLRKRGFEPVGFRGDGHLAIRHTTGFTMGIPSTPSDHRTTKNLMKEVDRGVKFMSLAGPQFERWFFTKWEFDPGETKLVEVAVSEQIRKFFIEEGVHGASRNAVAQWIRSRPYWVNTQPEVHGRGRRIYEITRPTEPEIIELVDLAEFEDEPPPAPEPEVYVPSAEEAETVVKASEVVSAVEANPLNPEVIDRLTEALAGPLKVELADRDEKLKLALGEIEAVDQILGKQYEVLCQAREMLLNLTAVLKG